MPALKRIGWLALLLLACPNSLFANPTVVTEAYVVDRVVSISREGEIARLGAAIARYEAEKARSPYDTTLSFDVNHRINANEPVVSVFGSRNDTTNAMAKLQHILPSGTALEGGYMTTRQKTNSPFATLNPAFDSAWFVGIRQPVLRDSFGGALRAGIAAAEAAAKGAEAQSKAALANVVLKSLALYWEWVVALEDEKVALRGVERAKEFLRITRKKQKLGTAEATEKYAAEANMAAQRQEVLNATERTRTIRTQFLNALLLDPMTELKPGEALRASGVPRALDKELEVAFEKRPEVEAAKADVDASEKMAKAARLTALPQLDITTSLSMNQVEDDWGASAGEAFTSDHPNFFVGGFLSIPLGNKLRRSEARVAKLQSKISALRSAQLTDDISTEVRVAWQSLVAAREQAAKAQELEGLEQKKLQAEWDDFRRGRSDAATILFYQQDLIRAERMKLSMRWKEAVAQSGLAFATGTLLPEGTTK